MQGESITYYESGGVNFKCNFVDSIIQGYVIIYDLNGEVKNIYNYKDGEPINNK